MAERDPNELGALWQKKNDKGTFFTGTVGGQRVVVFKNTRKTSENQPDWRVLKAQPREQAPQVDEEDSGEPF